MKKYIGIWFRDMLIRRKSMNATRMVAGSFAIIILLGTLLLMLPIASQNGQSAGTEGLAKRMEAVQIVLVKKGGEAPGSTDQRFVKA